MITYAILAVIAALPAVAALFIWQMWPEPERGENLDVAAPRPEMDWFVWESQQIQINGYAPWFDHWRYDGTPFAYPEPSAEQWRKVVEMSTKRLADEIGQERLNYLVTEAMPGIPAHKDPFERRRMLGQHPALTIIKPA